MYYKTDLFHDWNSVLDSLLTLLLCVSKKQGIIYVTRMFVAFFSSELHKLASLTLWNVSAPFLFN